MSQSTRTALLLLLCHITFSNSAKNAANPVYEVNEQARMDDKRTGPQTFLPYGNPLAGNSLQNAKIHAQHQQAMFNAERVRQHRAQLQRWTKIPPHSPQTDSYMKAYHDSQESHQLAVEQQQAGLNDKQHVTRQRTTVTAAPIRPKHTVTNPTPRQRHRQIKRIKSTESPETLHTIEVSKETIAVTTPPRQRTRQNLKRIRGPDPLMITLEDAVVSQKNRNHRSYGSVDQQHLTPKRYKTVYVSPGPTYDQGVTIKPNGNVGITNLLKDEPSNLYTEVTPSKYVYPKQFHQMQTYESAQDIAALNALLKKEPQDQVNELNALIHSDNNKELETPIDLYFYLKDPKLVQQYSQSLYAHGPQNYASAYMPEVKDHIPITEQIDDFEDPNKILKKPFTAAPTHATEDITTNLDYYQVDPTIASKPEFYKQEDQREALKYEKPLTFYSEDTDESEKYLHHNGQSGVQHLNQDGTGVSAYGDDDVSISNRTKRSIENLDISSFVLTNNASISLFNATNGSSVANLDTNLFVLTDNAQSVTNITRRSSVGNLDANNFVLSDNTSTIIDDNETLPIPEELRRRQVIYKNNVPFLAPQNYAKDDTFDDYDYEAEIPSDTNDNYNLEYDDTDYEYEPNDKESQLYTRNQFNFKKPDVYTNRKQNDLKGSYSHRLGNRYNIQHPQSYSEFNSYNIPSTSYGVPTSSYSIPTSFGVSEHSQSLPQEYGVPKTPDISSVVNALEPVYMLTQSQLKSLIGHHNLNIQHLDIFQWQGSHKNIKGYRPRRYKKKFRRPNHRNIRNNLSKLHKLRNL